MGLSQEQRDKWVEKMLGKCGWPEQRKVLPDYIPLEQGMVGVDGTEVTCAAVPVQEICAFVRKFTTP